MHTPRSVSACTGAGSRPLRGGPPPLRPWQPGRRQGLGPRGPGSRRRGAARRRGVRGRGLETDVSLAAAAALFAASVSAQTIVHRSRHGSRVCRSCNMREVMARHGSLSGAVALVVVDKSVGEEQEWVLLEENWVLSPKSAESRSPAADKEPKGEDGEAGKLGVRRDSFRSCSQNLVDSPFYFRTSPAGGGGGRGLGDGGRRPASAPAAPGGPPNESRLPHTRRANERNEHGPPTMKCTRPNATARITHSKSKHSELGSMINLAM